jgi:hypothetical protein
MFLFVVIAGSRPVSAAVASPLAIRNENKFVKYFGLDWPVGFIPNHSALPVGYFDGERVYTGYGYLKLAEFRRMHGEPLSVGKCAWIPVLSTR